MFGSLFKVRGEQIEVRLETGIRELLTRVSGELREILLVNDGEIVKRLYPPAYPDDPKSNEAFDELVKDKLLMQRLDDIDRFEETIDTETMDIELADVWMNTINQARLVLGTQLDVSEDDQAIDPEDPEASGRMIYQVLSYVLEELTRARIKLL